MSDGVYLFSFELLEAVLPVLGKLGLLALARLGQRCLDLHLPLAAPAGQAQTDLSIKQEEKDRKEENKERRKQREKKKRVVPGPALP